jgi:hypothetical protein
VCRKTPELEVDDDALRRQVFDADAPLDHPHE